MAPISAIRDNIASCLLLGARQESLLVLVARAAYLALRPLRELDAGEEHRLIRLCGFLLVFDASFTATFDVFE